MQTLLQQQTGAAPTAPAGATTLAELVDAYMAAYAGRDRTRVYQLAWWIEYFGTRPYLQITDEEVYAALERLSREPGRVYTGLDADGRKIHRRKPKPRSNATVNRYHMALMAVFTWAIKRRRAPRGWENPARKVERAPEKNGVVRFLSEDERERLLAACRTSGWPRLYCLVLMAITTGARRSELLSLTWRDIDFERGLAHVQATKNGEPRVLPLVPAVIADLERFKSERPEALLPSRSRISVPRSFEASWLAALKTAGIKRFRFHDLRHTCASYLAQNGASLLEIADVMGHRQLAMVKRYAHLTVDTKAKLVNRVLGSIK